MTPKEREDWEWDVIDRAKADRAPFTGHEKSLLARLRAEAKRRGFNDYQASFTHEEAQLWSRKVGPYDPSRRLPTPDTKIVPSQRTDAPGGRLGAPPAPKPLTRRGTPVPPEQPRTSAPRRPSINEQIGQARVTGAKHEQIAAKAQGETLRNATQATMDPRKSLIGKAAYLGRKPPPATPLDTKPLEQMVGELVIPDLGRVLDLYFTPNQQGGYRVKNRAELAKVPGWEHALTVVDLVPGAVLAGGKAGARKVRQLAEAVQATRQNTRVLREAAPAVGRQAQRFAAQETFRESTRPPFVLESAEANAARATQRTADEVMTAGPVNDPGALLRRADNLERKARAATGTKKDNLLLEAQRLRARVSQAKPDVPGDGIQPPTPMRPRPVVEEAPTVMTPTPVARPVAPVSPRPMAPAPASAPPVRAVTPEGQAAVPENSQAIPSSGLKPAADIVDVPLPELRLDPNRFQYKRDVGNRGVTNKLRRVDVWNDDASGTLAGWQDPTDGQIYVVNGHHRYELAERLVREGKADIPSLRVKLIDAPDAKTARLKGAILNIADESASGTAFDAASIFREHSLSPEDLAARGVPLSNKTANEGFALASLNDALWDAAVRHHRGDPTGIPLDQAVALGKAGLDDAQQTAAFKLLYDAAQKGKEIDAEIVADVAAIVKNAPTTASAGQASLFGEEALPQSTAVEKAQLTKAVRKQLGRDKYLFGVAGKNADDLARVGTIDAAESGKIAQEAAIARDVFNQFAHSPGEINDILNQGAIRLAQGEPLNAVQKDIYGAISEEVRRIVGGGEGRPLQGTEGGNGGNLALFADEEDAGAALPEPDPAQEVVAPGDSLPLMPEGQGVVPAVPPTPVETSATSAPTFRAGDRVEWVGRNGEVLTGTVRSNGFDDITVDTDQIKIVGGVPIGRIETVRVDNPSLKVTQPAPDIAPSSRQEVTSAAPSSVTEDPDLVPGTARLIDALEARLDGEGITDTRALTALADEAYGGTLAQGRYTSKDAYDALETAVNRWIERNNARLMAMEGREALRELRALLQKLPTQTNRTKEQTDLQQFSTPPTQAYVAARALGVRPDDIVLEPSAGTGGLASFVRGIAEEVYANELSPRRAALLRQQGYPTTQVDAEILNDTLPLDIRPTAILMNPPFSATGGRVKSNNTKFGAKHVESALQRLEEGGRLVAIVGQGMRLDTPSATGARVATGAAFRPWWEKISKTYTVRANLSIPGDEYQKYGTSFGNQLIIIDKTGPTPGATFQERLQNIRYGEVAGLEEALEALDPIAATRPLPVGVDQGPLRASAGGGRSPAAGGGDVLRPGRGTGTPAELPVAPRPEESPLPLRADEPGPSPLREATEADGPLQSGAGRAPDVREGTDLRTRSEEPARVTEPAPDLGLTRGANEDLADRVDEGSFTTYQPAKLKGGKQHPGRIVETASMAAVEPPDVSYTPKIPQKVIDAGGLSNIQLEAISYAGQRHSQRLPDGARAGYFIGDGTGVGKGREMAGIITDNYAQGRKRSLWISHSHDLIEAAKDDFKGVGGDHIPLHSIRKMKKGDSIATKADQGVLFTNYQSFVSKYKDIVEWLGEEGVIILDEAHKAKNAVPEGRAKASETGKLVVQIQSELPGARVVYSSATGMTDVRNMAYMSRLGLWGQGTPFASFTEFRMEIEQGGVGAMEMVARDMKALGLYTSRSLSFDGVEYEDVTHDLTPEQTEVYDTAARAWQIVEANITEAAEITGGGHQARNKAMTQFYGAQQQFFSQLIMAFKMPTLIRQVEYALANDMSPVVSFINTGESRMNQEVARAKAEGEDYDELDLSPQSLIRNLVEQHFPVQLYQEATDEFGNTVLVPVKDADGNPVLSQAALAAKDRLLRDLEKLALPDAPLDAFIDYFGEGRVAEMTGRSKRLKTNPKTGKRELMKRGDGKTSSDKVNIVEMERFQGGEKDVALISGASSTGISLHASRRAVNQKRRYHITWQVDWSADKQMQFFGRTHRSDQSSAPVYALLSSNVGGEKRFISTIARRLQSMGALTRGQRDATSGGDLGRFNYETPEGQAALRWVLIKMLDGKEIPGLANSRETLKHLGLASIDPKSGQLTIKDANLYNVTRFLNRVLALEIGEQNALFDYFTDTFQSMIQSAKETGTFDEGVADLKGESIRLAGEEVVSTHASTGAETTHYTLEVDRPTHPIRWEDALSFQGRNNGSLFYRQSKSGRIALIEPLGNRADAATGSIKSVFGVTTPKKRKAQVIDTLDLMKWEQISDEEAQVGWLEALSKIPPVETHETHIIGGAILPLWDRFKRAQASNLKVVRGVTDDGRRIVGMEIAEDQVQNVLRALGAKRHAATTEQLFRAVLNRDTVELAGGLTLTHSRIRGDDVIWVKGATRLRHREWETMGLRHESISWVDKYFIPSDETIGIEVLERLLGSHPAMDGDGGMMSLGMPIALGPAPGTSLRIPVAPLPNGEPKRLSKIVFDLNRALGRKVRVGNPGRQRRGSYYPGNARTVVRFAGDLDATAHEIAHALDHEYNLVGAWAEARQKSPFDAELIPHFSQYGVQGTGASLARRRAEGVAEWVRAYLVNPDAARAAAPLFHDHFQKTLPSKVKDALGQFSQNVREWEGLPATQKTLSNVRIDPEAKGRREQVAEFYRGQYEGAVFETTPLDRVKAKLVDDLLPFMKGVNAAKGMQGITDLLPMDDPEILTRTFGGVQEKIESIFERGMIDAEGNTVPGLENGIASLFEPFDNTTYETLRRDMNDTIVYMTSQRIVHEGQKMLDEGLDPNTRKWTGAGGGFETDYRTAQRALEELEADPERLAMLEEGAALYRQWAEATLRYQRDQGRITPEQYEGILENNPFYVDLHRVMDDLDLYEEAQKRIPQGMGKTLGSSRRTLHEFRGSTREIEDPYVNLMKQTYLAVSEADRNNVLRKFRDLLVDDRGMYEGDVSPLSEIGNQVPEGTKGAIKIYVDGVPEHWVFEDGVMEALNGWGRMLNLPLTGLSHFFRGMITYALPFITRNAMRDTQQRSILSNVGSTPLDIVRGRAPDDRLNLQRFGGGQSTYYMSDPRSWHREIRRDILANVQQPGTRVIFDRWLKKYSDFARSSEYLNREAEYRKAYKVGLARGYDEANAKQFAAAEARRLLDFHIAGQWVRVLNQYILFLNPRIQGTRRTWQGYQENPRAFVLRSALFMLPPLALARFWNTMMGKDEEYRQLPAHQRDFYWNFYISPKFGDGWLRIPKPHEVGVMASIFERAYDLFTGDPRAFEGYGKSLRDVAIPVDDTSYAPQIVRPLLEVTANYDLFQNRNIVSPLEVNRDVESRKGTKYASQLGQALMDLLPPAVKIDARNIDHLIEGYGGGFGRSALQFSNLGRSDRVTNPVVTIGNAVTGLATPRALRSSRDIVGARNVARSLGQTSHRRMRPLMNAIEAAENPKRSASEREASYQRALEIAGRLRKTLEARQQRERREDRALSGF